MERRTQTLCSLFIFIGFCLNAMNNQLNYKSCELKKNTGSVFSLSVRPYGNDAQKVLNYLVALINLQNLNHSKNYIQTYFNKTENEPLKKKCIEFYEKLCTTMQIFREEKDTLKEIYTYWCEPVKSFKTYVENCSYQDCMFIFIFNENISEEKLKFNLNELFKNQFHKLSIQPIKISIETEQSIKEKIIQIDESKKILSSQEKGLCSIL